MIDKDNLFEKGNHKDLNSEVQLQLVDHYERDRYSLGHTLDGQLSSTFVKGGLNPKPPRRSDFSAIRAPDLQRNQIHAYDVGRSRS